MGLQKSEVKDFIIAVLALGIIFGFDDGSGKFELGFWLTNFVLMCLLSGIALAVHVLGEKLVARRIGANALFQLWSMKRFGLLKAQKTEKRIAIGVIIALLLTLFSQGEVFFPAITMFAVAIDASLRLGRKTKFLNDAEIAKIQSAGPLASIIFGLLLSPLRNVGYFSDLMLITLLIGLLTLLPLPGLNGSSILFGSFMLYMFVVAFSLIVFILSYFTGIFSTLILALLLALAFFLVIYYYKFGK